MARDGLTSRFLRRIRVHAHVQSSTTRLRSAPAREQLDTLLIGTGLEEPLLAPVLPATRSRQRRGRPRTSDEELLQLVSAYTAFFKAGSRRATQHAAVALKTQQPRPVIPPTR